MVFKPTPYYNLIYYDYNIHNLIIYKYILEPIKLKLYIYIYISSTCSPFCKTRHFVQVETFLKIILNPTFKMGFSKKINIKWNITITLIIRQEKIKIMATCNFFNKELWTVYFTLLTPIVTLYSDDWSLYYNAIVILH
jgi:hypothetical protein